MAISVKKKRYMLTLTPANVERFQALCKRLGLPLSTMSDALNDQLVELCEIFQIATDKGTTGIVNLLKAKQQDFDLQLKEVEKNVVKKPEKKDVKGKSVKTARS